MKQTQGTQENASDKSIKNNNINIKNKAQHKYYGEVT